MQLPTLIVLQFELWHNFYNIVSKVRHILYTASGSTLPLLPRLKILGVPDYKENDKTMVKMN